MNHLAKVENGKPMRSAVVDKSGLVVNVIVTDGPADKVPDCELIESDTANIGDSFVDGVLVPKPQPKSNPTTPLEQLWAAWARNG